MTIGLRGNVADRFKTLPDIFGVEHGLMQAFLDGGRVVLALGPCLPCLCFHQRLSSATKLPDAVTRPRQCGIGRNSLQQDVVRAEA